MDGGGSATLKFAGSNLQSNFPLEKFINHWRQERKGGTYKTNLEDISANIYIKKSIKLFGIFSTAQKLPKIFTEFFGKCKICHKKIRKKYGKNLKLLYGQEGEGKEGGGGHLP